MAGGPWRCSECGTINEPVANSCRTCGRWPSLFDLEASVVEGPEAVPEPDVEVYQATTAAEPYDPRAEIPVELDELELGEDEVESDSARRRRRLTSLIVPLAFVVYLVISVFVNDRGG